MLDQLAALGVTRRSLLVIPNFRGASPIDRDEPFCAWLRAAPARATRSCCMGMSTSPSARRGLRASGSRTAGSTQSEGNS